MFKNYTQFLQEAGLDLGVGGGEEKKKKAPDPKEVIAKEKKKRSEKADKLRNKILDKAEEDLTIAFKKTPKEFNEKFEKRIMDSLDRDDRVAYHNLILDIQRFQMPKVRNSQDDEILDMLPVLKIVQSLNKNEYKG